MSQLSEQVSMLLGSICMKASHPAAEAARQKGEANRAVILEIIQKQGKVGETEISARTGINRTTIHHHLLTMEKMHQIKRASDEKRAQWVVSNPVVGRLVTFETQEDLEK